jgi:hypothetical protein
VTAYEVWLSPLIASFYRQLQETEHHHPTSVFGLKTATGTLRKHLYEVHCDTWVRDCDKRGIEITAKEAQPAIMAYRQ